jgi:hypothetical protein
LTIGWHCYGPLEELPYEFDSPALWKELPVRLIAAKDAPIWQRLGDSRKFPDTMGIPDPPYVRHEEQQWQDTWREIERSECGAIDLRHADGSWVVDPATVDREMFLEHNAKFDRWTERPSGKARLLRALGMISENAGDTLSALRNYQAAVNLDGEVGCANDIRRLRAARGAT